jgi:hypothetical protein
VAELFHQELERHAVLRREADGGGRLLGYCGGFGAREN